MNDTEKHLAIFEGKQIRRHWDENSEKWFFSVVDIVATLSGSISPLEYWRKLKERLKAEGNETVTKCHALKMLAADGKMRLTDVADTEVMLRLIQSIPSPNAEPLKLWLARVGYERLAETATTEISHKKEPKGLDQSKKVAKEGGSIAGSARRQIEKKTSKLAVTSDNWKIRKSKLLS